MDNITVRQEDAGKRLDKYLRDIITDSTRSQIKKKIKGGIILVNDSSVAVHYFLKEGDVISESLTTEGQAPDDGPVPKIPAPQMKIAEDTDDYLIIEKPAGLIVHEAPGDTGQTLVDQVLEKYPAVAKIGEDPMRPGIVHRLDKEVSGLMVVAKTQDMFDHLKTQFKSRKVKKQYIALAYGSPEKDNDEITFNIGRSETAGHKMAAIPVTGSDDRGKRAITEFDVIERLTNYTVLNIKPLTGRTHQIRVHLNAYGLPVVGDLVYHPKKLKVKIYMTRIFLHSHSLGFNDLDGKWLEYSSPLPEELEAILTKLRKA